MIPDELKALPQWVCAGANKVPLDPKTGRVANVMDPSTWSTFEVAADAGFLHVGFVLTPSDPYTFVDLDEPTTPAQMERHSRILDSFPTYVEYSQSGRGLHIICRGNIPRGVRRDKVEVYSDSRYMICTGNAFRAAPVTHCQAVLDVLFREMDTVGDTEAELTDLDETTSDVDIVQRASRALNGAKFDKLCRGEWEDEYASQSEADFALLSMLAFYSKSNAQVRRLFRYSKLGKRDKAQRDSYLNTALKKIRANEPPPIEFRLSRPEPQVSGAPVALEYPPGFVGEIAKYICESSLRPVAEIGIAAALALCAGIVGRQYNISGTGLNLYLIFLAKTGTGKEGATTGVDRILKEARLQVPMVDSFIGPGAFASGQAIIRALDMQPCFVSILGEFGLLLQMLSDDNSSSPYNLMMRRVLLDLYAKSGEGSVLRPSVYSDREKNTKLLTSPALTLFGESTPDLFYSGISAGNVADGLMPRFLLMEYQGDRPPRNPQAFADPPPELIARFRELCATALRMASLNSWCDVGMDTEAKLMLDEFDHLCDARIRGGGSDGVRQLWNRAHLNTLRVAGVLAAADNPDEPMVTAEQAAWAISLVQQGVALLVDRFTDGDIGEGDSKQVSDLRRVINEYLQRPLKELESYGVTKAMHARGAVPYAFLWRRLSGLSSFKKDRRGARQALRNALEVMVMSGILQEIPKQQMQETFNSSQTAYYVPDKEVST